MPISNHTFVAQVFWFSRLVLLTRNTMLKDKTISFRFLSPLKEHYLLITSYMIKRWGKKEMMTMTMMMMMTTKTTMIIIIKCVL